MNAALILVDSVELILVALLVYKNDAAHQRRVIKASRLKLDTMAALSFNANVRDRY